MFSKSLPRVRKGPSSLCIVVAAVVLHMPSQLQADSFVMKSGKVIEGTVAGGSDLSLFIKDKDGLLKSVMVPDIAEAQINLRSGAKVVGRLTGFRESVYEIATDEQTLYIKDGQVFQSVDVGKDDAPAPTRNAGGPAIGANTQNPASETKSGDDDPSDILKRAPL